MHLWPILFPFRYLGFDVHEPAVFHGVGGVSLIEKHDGATSALDDYTRRWTETLITLPARAFVEYNADADFDDSKRLLPDAPEYSPFIRHDPDLRGRRGHG